MSDLATVDRAPARGMITLRGDFTSSKLKRAVKAATGHAVPKPGRIAGDGHKGVAWMSPDELLLMVPYEDVASTVDNIASDMGDTHYLTVDVSDARAVFSITGPDANEVLARLCPVDLHKDSFAIGGFRRTRLAQVAAAFWRHDTGFDLVCFRSVADYAEGVLQRSALARKTGAL
ncbi:sarcosine oxidase subunit gamma [Octadecabacter sp. CECT 8868]|uniref:sarcosine oxidase subunit gamma n=1 Tax=Octadecabacter algicola TaxID=2909342 RepID=UPI001F1DCA31|nr:sarcosine oxidase subunit gamma family protein [Octadecabacter algicola]MCF2904187.1 sarcosine oxidase subunit gamma [Octadecabacter algicola]